MAGAGNGPGGLKVGDLYVSVTAAIGEAVKNLNAIMEKIEETADTIEEHMSKAAAALGDFSDGLLSVAAVAAGAFAVASKTSEPAKKALDDLTGSLQTLGKEVGSVFIPLVQEMTVWVKTAVATWRNLTSEQKDAIVAFVKIATVVGGLAKVLERSLVFTKSFAEGTVVLARVAGPAATAVSKGFSSMAASVVMTINKVGDLTKKLGELGKSDASKTFKMLDVGRVSSGFDKVVSAIKGAIVAIPAALAVGAAKFKALALAASPVLATVGAIALAVGSLVVLAAVLRDTWEQSGEGIKAWFEGITQEAVALGKTISSFVGEMFSSLTGFLRRGVEAAFEFIAAQVRWIAKMAAPVAKWVGADKVSAMFEAMANTSGKKMLEYLDQGVTKLWDAGSAKAREAMEGVQEIANKAGEALKDGASGAVDMLTTAKASYDRGMALLKKDFGFSVELPSINLPEIGDPNTVEGTKTLDEMKRVADDAAKFAKDALDVARDVASGLVDLALQQKDLMEKAQAWLAQNVMAPQFELLFRESLTPAIAAAKEAQQAIAERAKQLAETLAQARDALASKALGRMGEAPGIVESGIQGATVAGPLGAVAAVLGDLLTRSEQFKTLVEMVGTLIQRVADTLGQLVVPLQPLIGGLSTLAMSVVSGLSPALTAVGEVLEPLAPLFQLLGTMLAPLFQVLGQVLSAVMQPVKYLVEVALKTLFEVFKTAGLTVMTIVLGIREAWNGIVGAVQGVLRSLGDITLFGGKPLGFLLEWAEGLEGAKSDTSGLRSAINQLHHATYETALAQAEQAAAVLQATAAVDKMTASLTNVPSSWKYALRSFEAQNARPSPLPLPTSTPSIPAGAGGGAAPSSPAGPAPAPSGPVVDTINVYVQDENAAMASLETRLGNVAYRSAGSRGGRGRKPYGQDVGLTTP
ncbi:MAG TPA: hypothetical protein VFZ09_27600 [Archangium sp.]|uniref:hypothetical protein n=1 Tax=Archangium sp. TaxID=1872627 RepID=UPI002E2EC5B5|nr:hypothetical protein [Archangium sp.]HEX5750026.1 hypothetical protein [Archangium sp.]